MISNYVTLVTKSPMKEPESRWYLGDIWHTLIGVRQIRHLHRTVTMSVSLSVAYCSLLSLSVAWCRRHPRLNLSGISRGMCW